MQSLEPENWLKGTKPAARNDLPKEKKNETGVLDGLLPNNGSGYGGGVVDRIPDALRAGFGTRRDRRHGIVHFPSGRSTATGRHNGSRRNQGQSACLDNRNTSRHAADFVGQCGGELEHANQQYRPARSWPKIHAGPAERSTANHRCQLGISGGCQQFDPGHHVAANRTRTRRCFSPVWLGCRCRCRQFHYSKQLRGRGVVDFQSVRRSPEQCARSPSRRIVRRSAEQLGGRHGL